MSEQKKRALNPQEELFVSSLFNEELTNGDPRIAHKIAGYSPNSQVSIILKNKAIRQAIKERTEEYLAANGPKAVLELQKLLSNPNIPGAKVLKDVAGDVLDRMGIIKKIEDSQNMIVPNVTIILPPKNED